MATYAARRRRALAGIAGTSALLGLTFAWSSESFDVGAAWGDPAPTTTTGATSTTPAAVVDAGQLVIAGVDGTTPSRSLLRRAQVGQIAGVILMGRSTRSAAQITALTAALQAAARKGGQPPLLVMTDQEGGTVRRLRFARPDRSARAMAGLGVGGVRAQGRSTGDDLRAVGINVDLAPVADVPTSARSFLGTRSFGSTPTAVARNACAFADGLAERGVVATLKHFPGLGAAGPTNTDDASVSIGLTRAALEPSWAPYRQCGTPRPAASAVQTPTSPASATPTPGPLVMLSSAAYPKLTGDRTPAVLSASTYRAARSIGLGGPFITDALEAAALRGRSEVASRAVEAGAHLVLYTDETLSKAGRRDVRANVPQEVIAARAASVRAVRVALAADDVG